MIEAEKFVECASEFGYRWYAGVPCSFLTQLINFILVQDRLTYVSSANEGDALAAAAGAFLGGQRAIVMMQNSGLGNAVNPLTSLTHIFQIPVLLIITWRGEPETKDEPQHQLMGQITTSLLDTLSVPWEYFPTSPERIRPTLSRIEKYMAQQQRPYALVMRKGSVAPRSQRTTPRTTTSEQHRSGHKDFFGPSPASRVSRTAALRRILELTPEFDTVVIASTGYTGRELFALADRPNQLYMVGSMGCTSSLGLGLSMVRPDIRVIIVEGDGAALMRMGNFATLGAYGGANLVHIVLDNEVHDSTGGQPTVSARLSFAKMAGACGYRITMAGDDLSLLDALLVDKEEDGPRFGHLKICPGVPQRLPRPALTPVQVRQRFMSHLGVREYYDSA